MTGPSETCKGRLLIYNNSSWPKIGPYGTPGSLLTLSGADILGDKYPTWARIEKQPIISTFLKKCI